MYKIIKSQKCNQVMGHYDVGYIFAEGVDDINDAYKRAAHHTNLYRTASKDIRCDDCYVGVERE